MFPDDKIIKTKDKKLFKYSLKYKSRTKNSIKNLLTTTSFSLALILVCYFTPIGILPITILTSIKLIMSYNSIKMALAKHFKLNPSFKNSFRSYYTYEYIKNRQKLLKAKFVKIEDCNKLSMDKNSQEISKLKIIYKEQEIINNILNTKKEKKNSQITEKCFEITQGYYKTLEELEKQICEGLQVNGTQKYGDCFKIEPLKKYFKKEIQTESNREKEFNL